MSAGHNPGYAPVIVVGGGPCGLTAAIALARAGVPTTLLEAGPSDRQLPGSRAIYVHGTTLRMLDRLSPALGSRIAAHGSLWSRKRTTWHGREVYERNYSVPTASFVHATSLPQHVTEGLLLETCKDAGVDIIWEADVVDVSTQRDGVTLTARSGRTWHAEYVIAADGPRSRVRNELGIALRGTRFRSSFVVVDVASSDSASPEAARVFHYEHPAVEGRNLLIAPFAGGWRLDLHCRPEDDPILLSRLEYVAEWMATFLPVGLEGISWISTYQFTAAVAESFHDVHKRVLLVGDSAHLYAPFGARGLNSGLFDAQQAAVAVAKAVRAPAQGPDAVAWFGAARRQAAVVHRAAAAHALEHIEARAWFPRWKRRGAAGLASHWRRAGEWLDRAPYGPASLIAGSGRF